MSMASQSSKCAVENVISAAPAANSDRMTLKRLYSRRVKPNLQNLNPLANGLLLEVAAALPPPPPPLPPPVAPPPPTMPLRPFPVTLFEVSLLFWPVGCISSKGMEGKLWM